MNLVKNENSLKPLSRTHWRASLVPAAAVIPAPIAYIKVVAVKKLVVEFRVSGAPASLRGHGDPPRLRASFTVKKLECSKQAIA